MSAVLITACRKEEPSPTLPGATSDAAQVNPTPRIKAFIERALAADAKSGGTLSVDSAVWYVEAALNYSMTQTWIQADDIQVDSITIVLPATTGDVAVWDAGQAYLALSEALSVHAQDGVSHLLVVDVAHEATGAGLALHAYALVGSGYGKSINTNFGVNDYFGGFGFSSHCGCGSNQGGPGLCADKQIQARVNFALVHPVNSYWTDVEAFYRDHTTVPLNSFWYCEGTIFTPCDGCFTPSMLSNFTQGAWDAVWFPVYTPGKEPINIVVQGYSGVQQPPSEVHFQGHSANIRYGINVPPVQ